MVRCIDLLYIIIIITLISCDFTNLKEIELPEHQSKMVTVCDFVIQDTVNRLFLSSSISNNNQLQYSPLENANVTITSDGILDTIIFYYDFESKYYYSNKSISNFSALKLNIIHEDYTPINASQNEPTIIDNFKVSLEKEGGSISKFGSKKDLLIIEFNQSELKDYYLLSVNTVFSNYDTIQTFFENFNPALLALKRFPFPGFLFDDSSFSDQKIKIVFDEFLSSSNIEKLIVELYSINEESYNYYKSLKNYFDNETNLFVEPTSIISNIENGYGAFNLLSRKRAIIEI